MTTKFKFVGEDTVEEVVDENAYDRKKDWRLKENETVEVLKRKLGVIGSIAKDSTVLLMEDKKTHAFAIGIGLMQGLKYRGSLKLGVKGGIAAYGALILANTIQNVVNNRDAIKKA
jgi:hypothetical protein